MGAVWPHPEEPGSFHEISFVGATPVAVFLGFSLTAAVTVVESTHGSAAWRDAAAVLLSGAVMSLVLCLTWSIHAGRWNADPAARLVLRPEARVDPRALHEVRDAWARDVYLLARYSRRIDRALAVGLVLAVAGFAAAVVAFAGAAAGVAVVAVAAVTAALLALSAVERRARRPGSDGDGRQPLMVRLRLRLFPDRDTVRPEDRRGPLANLELDAVGRAALVADGVGPGRGDVDLDAIVLGLVPPATIDDLRALAGSAGVGELFDQCADAVRTRSDLSYTTQCSLVGGVVVDGAPARGVSLHLAGRRPGAVMWSVTAAVAARLGIACDELVDRLPDGWSYCGPLGWWGFVSAPGQLDGVLLPAPSPVHEPA